MSEMMLVTGGARSGKSSFAEREAAKYDRVLYVATGIAFKKIRSSKPESKNIKLLVQQIGIHSKLFKGLLVI